MPHTRPLRISRIACWAAIALSAVTLGAIAPLTAHAEPLTVTIIHLNDWDRMGADSGQGGDGYRVLATGQVLLDAASGDTMANHLIDYVRAAGTVAPVMEGRIVRED